MYTVLFFFFFFKQKTAYDFPLRLVASEMCIEAGRHRRSAWIARGMRRAVWPLAAQWPRGRLDASRAPERLVSHAAAPRLASALVYRSLATVQVRQRPNLWEYLWLQADDDVEIVAEEVVLGGRTPEENRGFNLELMNESKSIAIAVTMQPREKTMTDAEIDALAARIVAEVGRRTGGGVVVSAPVPKRPREPPPPFGEDLPTYLRSPPSQGSGFEGPVDEGAGDVDRALAAASHVVDATFTTAYLAHVPLETRAALAEWGDGRLTVWTGTQVPFGVRRHLAGAFDVAEADVRVLVPPTGSAFGGKHGGGGDAGGAGGPPGKRKRHGGADPFLPGDAKLPAVKLDQPDGERESETGAGMAPAPRARHLSESGDRRLDLGLVHADTVIGDRDVESFLVHPRREQHAVASIAELYRIGDEVEQHLLELQGIGAQTRQLGRKIDIDADL